MGTRGILADGTPDCSIVDTGHKRNLDLAIELQILSFYQLRRRLPAGVLP